MYYRDLLKELVHGGLAEIRLILSAPRTGATLLETVLGRSQDIDAVVHQPFETARQQAMNLAYKTIVDSIPHDVNPARPHRLLIKDLATWLDIQQEFVEFLPMVREPIVVNIRNPLLNTESRIRKVVENLTKKDFRPIRDILLELYAATQGDSSWETLLARQRSAHELRNELLKSSEHA